MHQLVLHAPGHRIDHVIVNIIQTLPMLIHIEVMAFVAVVGHRNATNSGVIDLTPIIEESIIVLRTPSEALRPKL